ncbi:hypothetical protein Hanom_Chr06g00530391 [Helianthus anomalus]
MYDPLLCSDCQVQNLKYVTQSSTFEAIFLYNSCCLVSTQSTNYNTCQINAHSKLYLLEAEANVTCTGKQL